MKNGLNSQKMKYCKNKVVWNLLRKNWLKANLKVLWYNYIFVALNFKRTLLWKMMKNVMISDTWAYCWIHATIKSTELLKGRRTIIR